MKNIRTQGFTLIELLVVVAIIGLLASVVLASLSSARNKGDEGAIKATLTNLRTEAELHYASNGSFSTLCANIATFDTKIDGLSGDKNCADDTKKWAYEAQLSNETDYWCVDYTGAGAQQSATTITEGSDYDCG
jgi:prepilin-type N-terminal cleavage/methylation domain-containing protein